MTGFSSPSLVLLFALFFAANSILGQSARWPWQRQESAIIRKFEPVHDTTAFLSPSSRPLSAAVPLLHSYEADSAEAVEPVELDAIATVFSANAPLPQLTDKLKDTSPQKFDLARALMFARMTSAAYCSNADVIMAWNCTRCQMGVKGFTTHSVVFDHVWDLLGYVGYSTALNGIVIAFRGTDSNSWGNWINNLRAWRANQMYPVPEAPHALVHSGFYNMWTSSALQPNITRAVSELLKLHPGAALYVTGHSMGAALAQLCALDLKFKLGILEAHAFTFGSPRVGNLAYQQLFNGYMNESWRFTHNRDVVPSLPPYVIGYHHVANEVWEVDVEVPGGGSLQKLLMCDDSGEDASCHNSICFLGICTSVADHLTYLGVPMYRVESEC